MRRLIGYRVVRERDGVREYRRGDGSDWESWVPAPTNKSLAELVVSIYGGRVVPVYLTVRRRRK